MPKPVSKRERLVLWPEEQAVALAVEWANAPDHRDAKRVITAIRACNEEMRVAAHVRPRIEFERGVRAETDVVRRWLAAAIDTRRGLWRGLPPAVAAEVNVQLDKLKGLVVPSYRTTGFAKNRLSERFVDFRPTPLAWAALGVALIADMRSDWWRRVGRCLYHTERFVFNRPYEGQRGPLRYYYCGPGCKVMMSRALARTKAARRPLAR